MDLKWASQVALVVKNLPASVGNRDEDHLEEGMATHSCILAWKNHHGQRILVGYSPWDWKESDMTE